MKTLYRQLQTALLPAMVCLLLWSPLAVAQSDINIAVSLDRVSIAADEQAVLQIEISGPVQDLPNPTLPDLQKIEVYSQGRSSNISIVNGQVSSSVTYRYILIPQQPGTFPISGIAIQYNNKTYSGNAVTLTVTAAGSQTQNRLQQRSTESDGSGKDYFLELSVDDKNPYVGQQVIMTLKLFIAVQFYGSPSLEEPSTTGFWTEVLGNKTPYYQKLNNRTYRVIERKYAVFPSQTGPLTIGRATITATVAVRSRQRDPFDMFGDLFGQGQQVQIRSEPLRVIARELPAQGRPSDFSGTVGRYSMSASVNKTITEAGQPVTLTIKISGNGNIKSVAEPVIPESQDFRVYKSGSNEQINKSADQLSGTKVIEQVFIPKRPGELTIPALSLNFFDPGKGTYQSVRTDEIKITATKPEGYAVSPDLPVAPPGVTIGSQSADIRFIKSSAGDLRRKGELLITNPLYIGLNAFPVALLAGAIIMRRRREHMAANVGLLRQRTAGRQAKKRLAKARSLASPEHAQKFHAELSLSLVSYIADKLNVSPHGLTSDRIGELLAEKSVDPSLIAELLSILRQCDFARFSSSGVSGDSMARALASAENLMTRMEGVPLA